MKILLASSSSGSRGGGELFLVYLGRALAQRDHQVTLWASTHTRMDELSNSFCRFGEVIRSKYANTYDRRGRSLASAANFWGARSIAAEWRRTRADIVHINKQNLEDGLDLLRAARWARLPSLATIHLTHTARRLGAKLAPIRDWIARRALCSYPGMLVTVLDRRWKDLLDFLGPSPRIRMVSNGVPLFDLSQREEIRDATRTDRGYADNNVVVVGAGRMSRQKRPLLFLEHALRLHTRFPQTRFLWIGEGPLSSDWDVMVRNSSMEAVVQRLPWQHDVQPLFFAADVFMHVAEFEGLPMALLEAMSAALPIAITPNVAAEMPFLTATHPILLNGDDSGAGVMDDREELRARGQLARALIKDQFAFERMAEGYEVLYKTLTSSSAYK